MKRLAVVHPRHSDWVPALREAAPDLDVRGCHPQEWESLDPEWLARTEALFCWKLPTGLAARMPRLAWVQNSGAGVDHLVDHPDLPTHVLISRSDGQFGFWMARYVGGFLLAEAQRIEECRASQRERVWNRRLLPEDLTGALAVLVGFGRIGRQIGRALRELGLEVHGVVRQPRPDPEFPLTGTEALPLLLPRARALVLVLPSTAQTRGLVDRRLLAHGHEGLTLFNVGRGDLVMTEDLLEALDGGRLRHAVLDVFPVEPLPSDSPLWTHPKVTVTPHHSGPSTPRQLVPSIRENLRRYGAGEPIQGAVDRLRGY